jgi:hypothetical protein
MTDLFDNVWGNKSEIVVDHCVDITFPVRLPWLILYTWPNILNRLRSLSLASLVVYSPFQPLWSYDSPYLGFGRRITWTTDNVVPPGHQMSFQKALDTVSNNLHLIIILPRWAMYLTKRTREVHRAFMELKVRFSKSS